MTKKKQLERANSVEEFKEYLLNWKLANLDLIQSANDMIAVFSTDELLNLNIQEPEEEVIIPQTEEEKEEILQDIIKEKGDLI